MAFTLIWSPAARLDLWDVMSYISEFDRGAASRFGRNVFDSLEQLIDFHESGRIVPEFQNPNIREIILKPCRIVYRLNKEESLVEIARIWHSARGVPRL